MTILATLEKIFIPSIIRARLAGRDELQKIASNTGWLVFDTVIQIFTNLFVGVWVARYLGPAQRGIMSYAESFLAIVVPISVLGVGEILVRELVRVPEDKYKLMGTGFVLQTVSYILFIPFIIGLVMFLRKGELEVQWAVAVLAFGNLFATARIFNFWFASTLESKYTVWSNRIAEAFIAILRVIALLLGASLQVFVYLLVLNLVLQFLAKLFFYQRTGQRILNWRWDFTWAKSLLRDGWPLTFSFIALTIYTQIDIVMVGQMMDNRAVGIYGEAARISKLWYFIPLAIATSVFPVLVRAYQNSSPEKFKRRFQNFLDVLGITGYFSAIPVAILAPSMMTFLYGKEYSQSGQILFIQAWTFIFVSLRYGMERWLWIRNYTKFSILVTSIGLILNVLLNLWWIPKYGLIGAAWGTVLSNALSLFLSCLIFAKLRPLLKPLILAVLVPFRFYSLLNAKPNLN